MRGKYLDPYSGFEFDTDYIPREAARCLMYHKQNSLTEYDLNSIPAADVEPARHAHWDGNGRCTACGGHAPYFAMTIECYKSPFCHVCGAKMDEVSE